MLVWVGRCLTSVSLDRSVFPPLSETWRQFDVRSRVSRPSLKRGEVRSYDCTYPARPRLPSSRPCVGCEWTIPTSASSRCSPSC
eukprot:scaffold50093_cov33-Phaeocystis_antarctica.AAC.2